MLLKQFRHCVRKVATVVRDPRFAIVQDADFQAFESICGSEHVKTKEIDDYGTDWMRIFKGEPACVLLPGSTEEVSALLAHCSRRRIAVVPQAGNTGLVGGSVPLFDEVVLSLKRINRHFEFDDRTGILSCDAGYILEDLDKKIASHGYMMPLDLGAKGSCMIGGNVASCAGGMRLLRYGSLHAHLLGLTVVLPTEEGTILKMGSALKKDNTSLHTPHLFLGSEGQLGVITHVTMGTVPKPTSVQSAMLGVETFDGCCEVLRSAHRHLSEILSSFEFLDREVMSALDENLGLKPILQTNPCFTLLIETSGSNEAHDTAKMERFLAQCIDDGLATDGVQAQSAMESAAMWRLRESAPLAVAADGFTFKNDISLPLQYFYQLSEAVKSRCLSMTKRIVSYGHLGDGNNHLNITAKEFNKELHDKLYPFIYEWVNEHNGSISAEHGIGQMKLPYATFGKSPAERDIVHRIKALFDPNGILNPYKTF